MQIRVTAGFGVASRDRFDDAQPLTAATLLEAADSALYRAKFAGRDQVALWSAAG